MARVINKLSHLGISKLNKPGRYSDGAGLYLQVGPTGGKSWLFRYMLNGKAREMGLGPLHTITLLRARELATEARQCLLASLDPIDARNIDKDMRAMSKALMITFKECASEYINTHKAAWKNAKHADQWANTLETYAYPIIGNRIISHVTTDDVLNVLKPIWTTKTETAKRVQGRICSVIAWAKAKGHFSGENPATWTGHLDQLLPKPSEVKKETPQPALPFSQMGEFMSELRKREGSGARALEFAILCGVRQGPVREATWAEIDFKNKTWVIPKEHMKGTRSKARDHHVPLSDDAITILKKMLELQTEENEFIFPGDVKQQLSNGALGAVIDRMNEDRDKAKKPRWTDPKVKRDIVPHGFRSTFSDWCSETTAYSSDVREMALAHTVPNKVEAAYRRGDLFVKRSHLMADWAAYCSKVITADDKVVSIAKAKAK